MKIFQFGSSFLAKNGISPVWVLISLSQRYGRRRHEEGQIQKSGCRFCVVRQGQLGLWGTETRRENGVMAPLRNGRNDALTPQGESEWTALRMEPMGHGEKEV